MLLLYGIGQLFFSQLATDLIFVALIAVCVDPGLVTQSIHLNQIKAPVPIPVFFKVLIFHTNKKDILATLYHTICFSFSSIKNNL